MNHVATADPRMKISTKARPTGSRGRIAFRDRNNAQTSAANSGVPTMKKSDGKGNGQARYPHSPKEKRAKSCTSSRMNAFGGTAPARQDEV